MAEVLVKQVLKKVKKGEIIFKENSIGNDMYIISSGQVQISKCKDDKIVILDILGEKEFFGEMALFNDKKRTATAEALEDSTLIIINKSMLDRQLRSIPDWFIVMFRSLVKRLEKADERIINQ